MGTDTPKLVSGFVGFQSKKILDVGFCRFLSVFCRIFVGFLQQYLKHIFLKIYESSQQKRLCSIHNLDQSVFGQSLSGLRQNAASVDCIREGLFL